MSVWNHTMRHRERDEGDEEYLREATQNPVKPGQAVRSLSNFSQGPGLAAPTAPDPSNCMISARTKWEKCDGKRINQELDIRMGLDA